MPTNSSQAAQLLQAVTHTRTHTYIYILYTYMQQTYFIHTHIHPPLTLANHSKVSPSLASQLTSSAWQSGGGKGAGNNPLA